MIQHNNLIGEGAVRAHQHVVCNCLSEDFNLKQNFPNHKYLKKYSISVSDPDSFRIQSVQWTGIQVGK
jgi:hypothetical protein